MLVIRYLERQSQTDRWYCSFTLLLFDFDGTFSVSDTTQKKYRKMNISMVPEKIRVSEDATFQAETHPGG
jgi:hypothetical protein